MKLITIQLTAGQTENIAIAGDYFRVISATHKLRVEFPDLSIATDYEAGLGLKLLKPFKSVLIRSEITQTVRIFYGFGSIDDSRLAGQIDLNGAIGILTTAAKSHTTPAKQTITEATPVLAENANRRSAAVQIDAACYVDSASDGITWEPGLYSWDAQSALTLVPVAGSVEVRILEELNV